MLNNYFATKSKKKKKRRISMAKHLRHKNLFFTSKCFMLYHLVQNLIYWLIVIIFPLISVSGCVNGLNYMSHIAIALYLVLILIFDLTFAASYYDKESLKHDLR